MKVSTRARYALRLMIDLAKNWQGSPVILREVARRQRISKRYLEQLATALKHARLVVAVPGRGGGYALPRSPENIQVSEIVNASIGPVNVVECVDHPDACSRVDECPSRWMWQRVNFAIVDVLENVTLADLCRGDHDGGEEESGASTPCSGTNVNVAA